MTLKQLRDINFEDECQFITARSGGAGGQHVNKVETKVILKYHILDSTLLDSHQKGLLLKKLSNKVNQKGEIVLQSQAERTQLRNRVNVLRKLEKLIYKALQKKKHRKGTKPSKAQKEERLLHKKKHSDKKALRRKVKR